MHEPGRPLMKVTVWGARGSIPVSGPQYIRYGGDTTCVEIETSSGDMVILDAGSGIRALGNKALAEKRRNFYFLMTHSHWDHLLGFPFFKPLYRPDCTLNFFGCTFAQESIKTILRETMRPPFFPIDLHDAGANLEFHTRCDAEFEMAGLTCRSFPLCHPNQGYGFILEENGHSVAFFPDNEPGFDHEGGQSREAYVEFFQGVDLLIHDAEYLQDEYDRFSRGWGHSVYLDTVEMAIEANVKRLVMWHINQDRPDTEVDAMLDTAQDLLQRRGVNMRCDMAYTGMTVEL